jgi:Flp pilus assembly protein TadG
VASDDSGSSTVELVLITPVLVGLLLFLIFAAQGSHLASNVKHAADSGARAGSMVSLSRAPAEARWVALRDLAAAAPDCSHIDVQSQIETLGRTRTIRVKVRCEVSSRDYLGLSITQRTVVAESTEVFDVYRAD